MQLLRSYRGQETTAGRYYIDGKRVTRAAYWQAHDNAKRLDTMLTVRRNGRHLHYTSAR